MTIMTSRGKTFEINWIWSTTRGGNRLMIELKENRLFSEIAADFEGVQTFTKMDSKTPNVKEIYEGFTALVGMSKENADGVIRLTLEKGDDHA